MLCRGFERPDTMEKQCDGESVSQPPLKDKAFSTFLDYGHVRNIISGSRNYRKGHNRRKPGITYGEQHTARPLLTPDEVRNLPQNLELLFLAGQRPIVAGKLAYYADSEFRGLFDQA